MSIETLTGVSFLCLAAVLLLVERLPGMGRVPASIAQRWPTNLGLWLLSGILSAAIYSESTTVIATTFLALILVFAPGFSALALYLLLATLSAVYTHANIVLPESFDKPIRWLLVTPSVHAIHHSSFQPQTDSNYSSVLTLWDRLFGTYRDPSTTQVREYGLEYFRGHEETALAPVLLQPFEYRRDIHNVTFRPEAQSPSTSIAAPLGRDWRVALSYAAAGLLLALIALWPTVIDLSRVWMNSEPYQYAWLVLPTFIYVVGWYHRDAIISLTPRPTYSGLGVVGVAAALWVAGDIVDIKFAQHFALVLTLQGIALCALGWHCYRALLFCFFTVVSYGALWRYSPAPAAGFNG